MNFKKQLATAGIVLSVAFGCNQGAEKEAGASETNTTDSTMMAKDSAAETKTQDFFQSLPSPIHVARIFQRAGLKYISGVTNPAPNASKYMSPYSKSVNLGVYTTDLAYCTFNDQSQEAISYFKAVKTLTDGLNLTSIFESTNMIPRFERNIGNKDSLVSLMATMSMESDILLKQTSRLDIAYLSFAGAWLESAYIGTQMLKNKKNPDILKRLLDQNNSLNKLIGLLKDFESKKEFEALISGLNDIKVSLDILNSENTAQHEGEFKKLITKVETLRNKITNDN
ncbi:MAG TPA: hypothetical protein PKY12_09590 [Catalimonadaceae bacterium]|jgi:hypothetical protein|nr:hypothetical protein [Catalimonadaceae bacterium]